MQPDTMEAPQAGQPGDLVGEQLSAMLDGELSADEARFVQRRLANDPALRARWSRMQVGVACLRNQPWQPMAPDLADRVAAALADEPARAPRRAPRLVGWAVAASIAALAVTFAPRFVGEAAAPPPLATTARPVATLTSADLVASASDRAAPAGVATNNEIALAPASRVAPMPGAKAGVARAGESPLAQAIQSPTDFPLLQSDKTWPRSTLAGADAPALEAYLVRHNQMMANDGLSGFVPYVDVVATDAPGADGANAAADAAPAGPSVDGNGTPAP